MSADNEEDSYEQYKKYLEESLGIFGIPPPPKPMNPYMRFYFERSCEEKSNGNFNMQAFNKKISEEWGNLTPKKKEFYQKIYEIRMKERAELQD